MTAKLGIKAMPDSSHDQPRFRGHLHAGTALVALPAGILLVLAADRTLARIGAAIYALSVLALFGTSACYHRLARSVRARNIMRRADHAMIFVLIAGTYTPICLLALPRAWGVPVLAVVGLGALAGVILKAAAFERLPRLRNSLYPLVGWTALAALPVLLQHLTTTQFVMLLAGGVTYTVGLPILLRRRPNPWPATFGYHEIWHVFTVVAGVCHYVLIGLLVTTR